MTKFIFLSDSRSWVDEFLSYYWKLTLLERIIVFFSSHHWNWEVIILWLFIQVLIYRKVFPYTYFLNCFQSFWVLCNDLRLCDYYSFLVLIDHLNQFTFFERSTLLLNLVCWLRDLLLERQNWSRFKLACHLLALSLFFFFTLWWQLPA
jgi:hypothetical protein